MKIGVLAIQGSVGEHVDALRRLGVEPVFVRAVEDLLDADGRARLNGLILPGGESTTIGKLMREFGLEKALLELMAREGIALWGTCAGAILLARWGLIDIEIERNAYGRQMDSFETVVEWYGGGGSSEKIPAVFIRAPRIVGVGSDVEILATLRKQADQGMGDGKKNGSAYMGNEKNDESAFEAGLKNGEFEVVAVRQGPVMATCFHPELTDSAVVHESFLKLCGESL